MRYCGHFLIKAEGGAKNYKCDTHYRYPGDPYRRFRAAKGIKRSSIKYLVLAIVIYYVDQCDFHLCLVLLEFLVKSMTGEEVARQPISALSVTSEIETSFRCSHEG